MIINTSELQGHPDTPLSLVLQEKDKPGGFVKPPPSSFFFFLAPLLNKEAGGIVKTMERAV